MFMAERAGNDRYEEWLRLSRRCQEVYGGTCKQFVGPPRWTHRINKYRSETKTHPTPKQALEAALNPETEPDVLLVLGNWDELSFKEVRRTARSNPNYPATE